MAYIRNSDRWTRYIDAHDEQRFWPQVDVSDDISCWEWLGGTSHGYGMFYIPATTRDVGAHIIAYLLSTGDNELDGYLIHHSCHNRRCCNPAHLSKGKQRDNIMDNVVDGKPYGVRKLQIPDVLEIASRLDRGDDRMMIAFDYNVQPATITDIHLGRNWGWLTGRDVH